MLNRDLRGSYIFRSLPGVDMVFGVPKVWFFICMFIYVGFYDFGLQMTGLFMACLAIVVGFLLARFYDPYFCDVFVAKLMFYDKICLKKIFHY